MALAAPQLAFPASFYQDDDTLAPVDSSGDSTPAFTFITQTGPPSKSSQAQQIVRKHVMREIGKSRRKGRPAKPLVLKVSLEVPDSPSWQEPAPQQPQPPATERDMPAQILHQDTVDIASELEKANNTSYQVQLDSHDDEIDVAIPVEREEGQTSIVRFGGGRSNPFARYPINMNSRAHELVDHIFDDENAHFRPFRDTWFPVGMLDPASFHQVLANSALSLSTLMSTGSAPESYESITYHSYAIQLVNNRMSDPLFNTSDELIGAVMAFVCYYNITGNAKNWKVHMNGLAEIIRLRGGPDTAGINPYIRVSLSWIDICGSATNDLPPAFPLPPTFALPPTFPTPLSLPLLCAQISLHWRAVYPRSQKIITILDDLSALTTYLKAEAAIPDNKIYSQPRLAITYINPLLHRLLSLSGSSSRSNSDGATPIAIDVDDEEDMQGNETDTQTNHGDTLMAEALRLAAILYLSPLRRHFGVMPVLSTHQLVKLRLLLQNPADETYWSQFPILYRWVLAMGVVEAQEADDVYWFVRKLMRIGGGDGYGSGSGSSGSSGGSGGGGEGVGASVDVSVPERLAEVVALLKGFIWMDDVQGVAFWRKVGWCSWEQYE